MLGARTSRAEGEREMSRLLSMTTRAIHMRVAATPIARFSIVRYQRAPWCHGRHSGASTFHRCGRQPRSCSLVVPPTDNLHEVQILRRRTAKRALLIVRVRLFAYLGTPRSADRARSLARVSKKREYFKCRPETIGDFAPKLCKLGV
jgi:hypothetical protein